MNDFINPRSATTDIKVLKQKTFPADLAGETDSNLDDLWLRVTRGVNPARVHDLRLGAAAPFDEQEKEIATLGREMTKRGLFEKTFPTGAA